MRMVRSTGNIHSTETARFTPPSNYSDIYLLCFVGSLDGAGFRPFHSLSRRTETNRQRRPLPLSHCSTKIVDGTFENHLAEFEVPASRTHGGAERALDRRKDSFNHPAAVVPAAAPSSVVRSIKRRVDPVFDQWSDAISAKIITKRFPVVGSISGQ